MQRYQKLRSMVLPQLCAVRLEALREEALTHTMSVVDAAVLLACRRKEDQELCASAALLHDLSIYVYNSAHRTHAAKSAEIAVNYLQQAGFVPKEIEQIKTAIARHSDKAHYHDPFCEILKDADILARFLQDQVVPREDVRRIRLAAVMKELNSM